MECYGKRMVTFFCKSITITHNPYFHVPSYKQRKKQDSLDWK